MRGRNGSGRRRANRGMYLVTKGSAAKRHRQSVKRHDANKAAKTRLRTAVRKLRAAIESKDKTAAEGEFRACSRVLDSAASSGVIHRNTAARRKSRLAKALAAMGAK